MEKVLKLGSGSFTDPDASKWSGFARFLGFESGLLFTSLVDFFRFFSDTDAARQHAMNKAICVTNERVCPDSEMDVPIEVAPGPASMS